MKTTRQSRRAARQLFRFCLVNGVLDEARARAVAAQLASAGRRGALPILAGFHRLVRLNREQHSALVESAAPLPQDLRQEVVTGLARRYGPGIDTSFIENAALIGGMRIRVGSDVYDSSVQSRLAALEAGL
jgi:F-type H+-transporting ATPase subunit delta